MRGHVRRTTSHEGKKRSLLQSSSASGCACMWLSTQGGSAARLAVAASVHVQVGVRALSTSAACAKPRRQRNRNNPFPLNAMKHFAYDDIPTFGHVKIQKQRQLLAYYRMMKHEFPKLQRTSTWAARLCLT